MGCVNMEETSKNKTIVWNGIKGFFDRYPVVLAIIGLMTLLSILSNNFLSAGNLMNVLRQISMIAILGAGLAFVMIGGEIDISVGSTVGLVNVLWAKFMVEFGIPIVPAALICVGITVILGLFVGLLVAKVKIPALIATFAMMSILRGIVFVITDAYPIYNMPEKIFPLARGYVFNVIPIPAIIMIVIFVIAQFTAKYTKFGRLTYAVGGNKEAAHLSGVNVMGVKIATFVAVQVMAALAAFILTSRLGLGSTQSGVGWEFEGIIGCIVGGVSLAGGRGKPIGALLGCIFVGLMVNGMTLLDISSYYQQITKGAILIGALAVDVLMVNRRKRV